MFPHISSLSRMRVYAVRTSIVTAFLDNLLLVLFLFVNLDELGPVINGAYIWAPIFILMAIHHAVAALGPWKRLINAVDLTLLCAEVGFLAYLWIQYYGKSVIFSLPIGLVPRIAAISVLFIDRIALAISGLRVEGSKYLIKTVKLVPKKERLLLTKWQILCGRRLLSSHLLGESKRIIFPRFVLAYATLFFITGYAFYTILVQPQQPNQVWVRQINRHTLDGEEITDTMFELFGINGNVELSLQLTPPICYRKGSEDSSGNRSIVTYKSSGRPPQTGSCTKWEEPEGDEEKGQVCVTHNCPFIPLPKSTDTDSPGMAVEPPPPHMSVDLTTGLPFDPNTIPDLMVMYDFSNPLGQLDEVYVKMKMMSSSQKWGQSMRLTRGSHDVVSYVIDFGDELGPRVAKSLWGLVTKDTKRVAYAREISRSHDTTRNITTAESNLGSIRLTRSPQDTWALYEQNFKSDIFDGVSSVGGFWTVLNGVFLIICGRGLLGILIGQRPLSAVGLLHLLSQKRLQAAAMAGYPQVEEDRDRKGLPALIADYFAEMEPLVEGGRETKVEESESDEEDTMASHPLDWHGEPGALMDSEMGEKDGHHSTK